MAQVFVSADMRPEVLNGQFDLFEHQLWQFGITIDPEVRLKIVRGRSDGSLSKEDAIKLLLPTLRKVALFVIFIGDELPLTEEEIVKRNIREYAEDVARSCADGDDFQRYGRIFPRS